LSGEDFRAHECAVDVVLEHPEIKHVAESGAGLERKELGHAGGVSQHAIEVRALGDIGRTLFPLRYLGIVLDYTGAVEVGEHVVDIVLEYHDVGKHLANRIGVSTLERVGVLTQLGFAVLEGPLAVLVDVTGVRDAVGPTLTHDGAHHDFRVDLGGVTLVTLVVVQRGETVAGVALACCACGVEGLECSALQTHALLGVWLITGIACDYSIESREVSAVVVGLYQDLRCA